MAQATAIKTYDAIGDREDLTDTIAVITRHETPFYSTTAKSKAEGRYHEWQIDTLSTANSNAAIEGADFTFAIPGGRTRTGNYTQIFTKTLEVSESQRAVSVAGLDDEFAYQMEKRMKEIATDIEAALLTGTQASGASGTARTLKGALTFIATNVETGTGTASHYLTETLFNNALQTIWNSGGRPDTVYVNGFQKRQISSFSTPNQRYVEISGEGELRNTISAYDSDFGRLMIELNPFMPKDKTFIAQKDMWSIPVLRGIKPKDVATVGDAKRGALVGELTLQANNEAASGSNQNLLTS